jgi:hypothetical protein
MEIIDCHLPTLFGAKEIPIPAERSMMIQLKVLLLAHDLLIMVDFLHRGDNGFFLITKFNETMSFLGRHLFLFQ